MASITDILDAAFRKAIADAFGIDADPIIAAAVNPQFGDYQSNAAMGLAKRVGESTGQKANPRQIAEQIRARLSLGDVVTDISIAGPGFINVRLNPAWLVQQANRMLLDPQLGVSRPDAVTVVIDYSAPNVAKEMHVGHLRSTIIGDCFARVLSFLGHRVVRQNHLGDWGTQFGMLIEHLTSIGADAASKLADLEGFYRESKRRFDTEPEFAERARHRVVRLQAGNAEELGLWKQIVGVTRQYIQSIYDRLGVLLTEADERGESFYNPALAGVVDELVRTGIAVLSDGAKVIYVEGYEAPLMIQKTDGGYGYGTTDLAAVRHRVGTLGSMRNIYVVGAPQHEHLTKVFRIASRANWDGGAAFEHAAFGNVLGEDGKMFKTRAGGTVKLADLLNEAEERATNLVKSKNDDAPDERKLPADALPAIARSVGIGAVKYFDLCRDRIGDYKFSFDAMLAMDGNTAPYMQYAYARVKSIFRRAGVNGTDAKVHELSEPAEVALVKHLLKFGETIDAVARELKPHFLCTYLYELAGRFSSFYEACGVLDAAEPTRMSRLALCSLTARTLSTGLDLLGIEHPEQM
jgi:arginyl-tRNA synthetase